MSKVFVHVKPLPQPEARPSRRFALGLYLLCCAGLIVSSVIGGFVTQDMNAQTGQLVDDLIFYLPFMALPIALKLRHEPKTLTAYRPGGFGLGTTISIVLLALLGFLFTNDLTLLWAVLLQKLGIPLAQSGITDPQNTRELMLAVLSVAVIPSICEEFCFRGAIFSALEAGGTRRAMILSSLLFTGLHASISGAPAEFLLGLMMCYLTYACNSIYAGMIYHTVHNTTSLLVSYTQSSGSSEAVTDYLSAIGGLSGVISLIFGLILNGILLFLLLRPFKLRAMLTGIQVLPRKREKPDRWELLLIICIALALAFLYSMALVAALG